MSPAHFFTYWPPSRSTEILSDGVSVSFAASKVSPSKKVSAPSRKVLPYTNSWRPALMETPFTPGRTPSTYPWYRLKIEKSVSSWKAYHCPSTSAVKFSEGVSATDGRIRNRILCSSFPGVKEKLPRLKSVLASGRTSASSPSFTGPNANGSADSCDPCDSCAKQGATTNSATAESNATGKRTLLRIVPPLSVFCIVRTADQPFH